MNEMKIGDFSKPLVDTLDAPDTPDAPKAATAATTATAPEVEVMPTEAKLSTAEQQLEDEAKAAQAALKPKVQYEEMLKEAGISAEEAVEIVDAVLFKGHYAEKIQVSSRVSVILRTRQARDTARALSYLEVAKPLYENHFNEIVSKYSLAASLESLGSDTFTFPTREASAEEYEKAFQTRLNYVDNLPDPVLRLLFVKVFKFDKKVQIILQEGAIENF